MLAPKQAFVRQMLAEGRTIAETAAAARLSFAQVAAVDAMWSAPKGMTMSRTYRQDVLATT